MEYIATPVEVEAFRITDVGSRTAIGTSLKLENGLTVVATPEMTSRMTPVIGDYWVIQKLGGYIYLNPKDVFERKYTRADQAAADDVIEINSDGKVSGPPGSEEFLANVAALRKG